MKIIVQAIYENGQFRPLGPVLGLEEKATVLLTIVQAPNALGPSTPVNQQAYERVQALLQRHDDTGVPPELWQEVSNSLQIALSNVRDPEVMRQAAERMDRMSQEVYEREGLLDIVMPLLREMRNGE
jgi:predicted DNA-binding antitoxin AbrB/MazE fold protein